LDDLEDTAQLQYLKDWLAVDSKRGLHGFIDIAKE
jgi:UDP-N-acetylglucosamine acyltransferase